MNQAEALCRFYQKNNIDYARASDARDGSYDQRIAELPEQVERWMSGIRAADRETFLTLLSRYTYLTRPECQLRYGEILSLLEVQLSDGGDTLAEVLFVTIESSGVYASGGDNVRSDMLGRNLRRLTKKQVVAAQSRFRQEDLTRYHAVVFLDDIVGSGVSLWGTIRDFCGRFALTGPENQKRLFYACIAPRRSGVRHVEKNCRKSGISIAPLFDPAWYQEPAFEKNSDSYQKLESYERVLGRYMMPPGESFFMGYQENRLLVSFHYNTPNNTLCTFWRMGPGVEAPPFYRDGNQVLPRPGIAELKAKKAQMQTRAYGFGMDRRRKNNDE